MKLFRLVFLIAAMCVSFIPAHALDRHAFVFTNTTLQVSLDPATHTLAASGTVQAKNVSPQSQRDIALQISSSLSWQNISAGDDELSWVEAQYTSDIDHTGALSEAIVHLPEPIAPGSSVTLNVRYSGELASNTTRLTRINTPEAVATRSDWDQLNPQFAAFRGIGYVAWYPIETEAVSLANGSEVYDEVAAWVQRNPGAQVQVTFTWPNGDEKSGILRIVSNGEPRSLSTNAASNNASAKIVFKGADVPVVVLAPFATLDRESSTVFHLPQRDSLAKDYALAVERDIPVLEDWFGKPRRKVVIVELTSATALPFQVGSYLFAPLQQMPAGAADAAVARTLVHACFSSPRPWIMEGLATFAQALIREHELGRRAALAYLNRFGDALAAADRPGATLPPTQVEDEPVRHEASAAIAPQPLTQTNDDLFIHAKAAFVWWMLRDMLGDTALRSAIAAYKPADDHEPSYMQHILETRFTNKRSLEQFFDDWVYRDRGLPDFRIESVSMRQKLAGEHVVAVTVENLGKVWAEVPVVLQSKDGERSARVVVPAHERATVRISVPVVPTKAVVNDGSVPESDVTNNAASIETSSQPGKP
ncbi:MAG TPA: hypothetical protein VF786_05585 [Terriglobales bacterium]